MSGVTMQYPKLKLASQLREAGGMVASEAVAAATANLAVLRPRCLTELQMAAEAAQACFQRFPAEFAAKPLEELYAISARTVGIGAVCGTPAADTACVSLCDLLDRLGVSRRWDLPAIAVHVQTLQLLASTAGSQADAKTTERILDGLRKVSARYIEPPPAAGA